MHAVSKNVMPILQGRNEGTERLSYLLKITQQVQRQDLSPSSLFCGSKLLIASILPLKASSPVNVTFQI